MKYFLIPFTIIDGEHEYSESYVFSASNEMTAEQESLKFCGEFFGEETKREGQDCWGDGERAIKRLPIQEINKKEYEILEKFI